MFTVDKITLEKYDEMYHSNIGYLVEGIHYAQNVSELEKRYNYFPSFR